MQSTTRDSVAAEAVISPSLPPKKSHYFQKSDPKNRQTVQHLEVALSEGRYIVFDLETTGGNPERNGITEIFALRWCNGVIEDTFYSLVNPQISIPPIVRRMTGITNQMVKDAPTIKQVMPGFLQFVGNDVLVSHNTIGDMKFLVYFAERVCKHAMENFYLCTHLLAEKLLASSPDKSLQGLTNYLNIPSGTVHRAKEDSYLTWELFKVLLHKLHEAGAVSIADAIRFQGDLNSRLRLGWRLDDAYLNGILPAKPGVLSFYDGQQKLLFLTSTANLKGQFRELSDYYNLPKTLQKTILLSAELRYQESPDLFAAMLSEAQLAEQIKQGFTPINWHLRFVWAIIAVAVDHEGIALRVGPLCEKTLLAWGPIYDRKAAQACLEILAGVFATAVSNKHGLICARSNLGLVAKWLAGKAQRENQTAEGGYFTMSSVLNIKVLISARYRQELLQQWRFAAALRVKPCPLRTMPLLRTVGLLVKTCRGKNESLLIPLKASQPEKAVVVGGEWRQWLATSAEGKALIARLKASGDSPPDQGLSSQEANTANAVHWMLNGTKVQKHHDYKFYPTSKL